jgi:hypothetical protein
MFGGGFNCMQANCEPYRPQIGVCSICQPCVGIIYAVWFARLNTPKAVRHYGLSLSLPPCRCTHTRWKPSSIPIRRMAFPAAIATVAVIGIRSLNIVASAVVIFVPVVLSRPPAVMATLLLRKMWVPAPCRPQSLWLRCLPPQVRPPVLLLLLLLFLPPPPPPPPPLPPLHRRRQRHRQRPLSRPV